MLYPIELGVRRFCIVQHARGPGFDFTQRSFCQTDSFSSRIASPAPLRFASRISEYLRDNKTPGAPACNAAVTDDFTLCGVHLWLPFSVGISISIPGQINVFVPSTPSIARFVSRKT